MQLRSDGAKAKFSPNGKLIAAIGKSWDFVAPLPPTRRRPNELLGDRGGKLGDAGFCLFDTANGKRVARLTNSDWHAVDFCFTPDSKLLLAVIAHYYGNGSKTLKLSCWDVEARRHVRTVTAPPDTEWIDISNDGKLLLASGGIPFVLTVPTLRSLGSVGTRNGSRLRFTQSGRHIVGATWNQKFHQGNRVRMDHTDIVWTSPNAPGTPNTPTRTGDEIARFNAEYPINGHSNPGIAIIRPDIAFFPHSWENVPFAESLSLRGKGVNGQVLVIQKNEFELWKSNPRTMLWSVHQKNASSSVLDAAFCQDGRFLVVSQSGVRILDSSTFWQTKPGNSAMDELKTIKEIDTQNAIRISSAIKADRFVMVTRPGHNPSDAVSVWDVPNGEKIVEYRHSLGRVTAIATTSDGRQALVSFEGENVLHQWDTDTGQDIRVWVGHSGNITSIACSPDGAQVLTGSVDGTVCLWNPATGEKLHTFLGHEMAVQAVTFSTDGARAVSADAEDKVIVWQIPGSRAPTSSERQIPRHHLYPALGTVTEWDDG